MRKHKPTQKADVLQYLQEHRGITPAEAETEFRAPIRRLAAVIHELRKDGYNIATLDRECENAYGKCKYAEYRLVKGEN